MSNKNTERPSFAKGKAIELHKGSSGVTATTEAASKPYDEPKSSFTGETVAFDSSELLFQNIDKLANKLGGYNATQDEACNNEGKDPENNNDFADDEEVDISGLSEEEVIANLDMHLGLSKSTFTSSYIPTNSLGHNVAESPKLPSWATEWQTNSKSSKRDIYCRTCGMQYNPADNYCAQCGDKRDHLKGSQPI